jgi:uncharacterized protein
MKAGGAHIDRTIDVRLRSAPYGVLHVFTSNEESAMETTVTQDRETNAKLLAEGYAAFGRNDMEKIQQLFHPNIVWHALRLGELSGDHVGIGAVLGFFGRTMELSQGTFSVAPEEILASETTGVAIVRSRGKRGGRELDDRQVHLFRLERGQVVEVWQYTGPDADAFWA